MATTATTAAASVAGAKKQKTTATTTAAAATKCKWNTKLTSSFPCRVPVVGAPMAGVSGGLMAARVCRAGALGFLSTGYFQDLDFVRQQIEIFRSACAAEDRHHDDGRDCNNDDSEAATTKSSSSFPLCLGFVGHAALGTDKGWKDYEAVLDEYRPEVVQFFAPSIMMSSSIKKSNVELAHQYGAKFMAQVGSVEEAKRALQAGADALIAQGGEAGGHGLRQGSGTLALASQVRQLDRSVPVVAAGGIVNGRGVAAVLALGCDGAVLGTRLWASEESIGKPELQKQLVLEGNGCDQVVRTTVFDQIENNFLTTPWPQPYDSVGVLRNDTSEKWDGSEAALDEEIKKDDGAFLQQYKQAQKDGNVSVVKVLAGEGVGEIDSIEPAYDIVRRVEQETYDAIQQLSNAVG